MKQKETRNGPFLKTVELSWAELHDKNAKFKNRSTSSGVNFEK